MPSSWGLFQVFKSAAHVAQCCREIGTVGLASVPKLSYLPFLWEVAPLSTAAATTDFAHFCGDLICYAPGLAWPFVVPSWPYSFHPSFLPSLLPLTPPTYSTHLTACCHICNASCSSSLSYSKSPIFWRWDFRCTCDTPHISPASSGSCTSRRATSPCYGLP